MGYTFVEEEEEESIPAAALRNVARQGSNLLTRGVGLAGDVLSLANAPIKKGYEYVTGKEGAPYEETPLGKLIPTTEQHRAGVEAATGEYLKPKNKVEQFADDVVEDFALLFTPGGKAAKASNFAKSAKNKFARSIGANLLGETVSQVSDNEKAGAWTKSGALVLSSLISPKATAKEVSSLYNKASKAIPQDAKTSAVGLKGNLKGLKETLTKKRPYKSLGKSEKFVVDKISQVENLIKDRKIDVQQAWAQKKALGDDLKGLYQDFPAKETRKGIQNQAKRLTKYLDQTLEEYGRKNPDFLKNYKNANEAFSAIEQSKFVSNWVKKTIGDSRAGHALIHLFGGGPLGAAAGAAAGVVVPYQATKMLYRIRKSPTLTKIYGKALNAAANENKAQFLKYYNQLDKAIEEEENSDKWRFVD